MKKLLVIICTLLVTAPLSAQNSNKMIKGNGNIIIKKRTLDSFTKLYVNMFTDVDVTVGGMPMIEITADANIEKRINATVVNGMLTLETVEGYWLQESRPKIKISVPFLTEVRTYGQQTNVGNISITGIDVQTFKIDMLYGNVSLQGNAEVLEIASSNSNYYNERGTLDATALKAVEVRATIQGSNSASVFATEKLKADLKHDAVLNYKGNPGSVKLSGNAKQIASRKVAAVNPQKADNSSAKTKKSLSYVSLKIQNNSALRRNFVIKGPNPSGRTFSYGFPMNPFSVREEKVPVGTAFYLETLGVKGKKLVEVTAQDAGKTVKLF